MQISKIPNYGRFIQCHAKCHQNLGECSIWTKFTAGSTIGSLFDLLYRSDDLNELQFRLEMYKDMSKKLARKRREQDRICYSLYSKSETIIQQLISCFYKLHPDLKQMMDEQQQSSLMSLLKVVKTDTSSNTNQTAADNSSSTVITSNKQKFNDLLMIEKSNRSKILAARIVPDTVPFFHLVP